MMKKLLIATLIITIVIGSLNVSFAAELPLKDISKHWAKDNIMLLYNQRLVGGYPDGTYKPENPVNLVEFLKLATLAIGYKLESGQLVWYENYLNKAIEINLIGKDEYPNPIAALTREQVAKIAVKALAQIEEKPSQELDELIKLNIRDYSKISDDKKQDVIDAYRIGIMAGNPDGFFNPQGTLTRAEMCTIIIRIMDKTKRKPFDASQGYAIKLTNIYSGEQYVVSRPDRKQDIQLTYRLRDKQNLSSGWYFTSYYENLISIGLYPSENSFKTNFYDADAYIKFSLNDYYVPFDIIVYNALNTKALHRNIFIETFNYKFGVDGLKLMALFDKYLGYCTDENSIGLQKKDTVIVGKQKVEFVKLANDNRFTVKLYTNK